MFKIYHNPRCRKSREGLALLEASGQKFEVVHYLEDIPSAQELRQLIAYLDITPEALVRKSEADWKAHFKGKILSDEAIINAMVKYPKLIERPIVVKGNKAVLGRPPENIARFLN